MTASEALKPSVALAAPDLPAVQRRPAWAAISALRDLVCAATWEARCCAEVMGLPRCFE